MNTAEDDELRQRQLDELLVVSAVYDDASFSFTDPGPAQPLEFSLQSLSVPLDGGHEKEAVVSIVVHLPCNYLAGEMPRVAVHSLRVRSGVGEWSERSDSEQEAVAAAVQSDLSERAASEECLLELVDMVRAAAAQLLKQCATPASPGCASAPKPGAEQVMAGGQARAIAMLGGRALFPQHGALVDCFGDGSERVMQSASEIVAAVEARLQATGRILCSGALFTRQHKALAEPLGTELVDGKSWRVVLRSQPYDVVWLSCPTAATNDLVIDHLDGNVGGTVRLSDGSAFENPPCRTTEVYPLLGPDGVSRLAAAIGASDDSHEPLAASDDSHGPPATGRQRFVCRLLSHCTSDDGAWANIYATGLMAGGCS